MSAAASTYSGASLTTLPVLDAVEQNTTNSGKVYTVISLKRLLVLYIIWLLLKVINLVLNDGRFELPSSLATAAHSIAEEVILWLKDPGHTHVFN